MKLTGITVGSERVSWGEMCAEVNGLVRSIRASGICRLCITEKGIADPRSVMIGLLAAKETECDVVIGRSVAESNENLYGADAIYSFVKGFEMRTVRQHTKLGTTIFLLTSGTTGAPKVIQHSFHSLYNSARVRSSQLDGARWLLTFQPNSFAGLQFMLSALSANGDLFFSPALNISSMAELAGQARPTIISGTPTFWRGFIAVLGKRASNLPLAWITIGGEVVDQKLLDQLHHIYPVANIRHIYASSECGALPAVTDGISGLPASWLTNLTEPFSVAIRDGMLCVKSPHSMKGFEESERSSAFYPDGYIATGDLVRLVENRIHFVGRVDLQINVGGAKVSPEEVETYLRELQGIEDARVYAVSSSIAGKLLAADLVINDQYAGPHDPSSLRAMIYSELISNTVPEFKIPRFVKIVPTLNKTVAGKLVRAQ